MCTERELYRWSTTIHNSDDEEGLYVEECESSDEISLENYDEMRPFERGGGNKNNKIVVVGVYSNAIHDEVYWADTDGNTLVTVEADLAAEDSTIKVWNKTTCESLFQVSLGQLVSSIVMTRDGSTLLCSFYNWTIQFRRTSDNFRVFKTIQLPEDQRVGDMTIYCELEDGTFILDSQWEFQRWDFSKETTLQIFTGHEYHVFYVIELKTDVIVSSSQDNIIIWRVSTGERLHKLTSSSEIRGLVKLSDGFFATGESFKIRLWNEHGHNYATYSTEDKVRSMIRLVDGSIVTRERDKYHRLLTIVKQ